jgi:hypothetical protein
MATQGGYRKPGTPAPVSGPGALSKRTDGRIAEGYAYGMNKQINEQAAAAPMAKAPRPVPGAQAMNVAPPQTQVTPLSAPTMNPDESVMSGINMGAGPGSEALMLPSNQDNAAEFNKSISSYYPVLSYIASRPNTSPETRRTLAILMNEV